MHVPERGGREPHGAGLRDRERAREHRPLEAQVVRVYLASERMPGAGYIPQQPYRETCPWSVMRRVKPLQCSGLKSSE